MIIIMNYMKNAHFYLIICFVWSFMLAWIIMLFIFWDQINLLHCNSYVVQICLLLFKIKSGNNKKLHIQNI